MSSGDRRLKALFLTAWYPSEEHPVAGVFVREHALAAAQYDDVVVAYASPAAKKIRGLYSIADGMDDGIRTVRAIYRRLPLPKLSYLVWLYLQWLIFRRLKREGFLPDVIHAHVYYAGAPAALLGRLYGIPFVLTEHSSAFPERLLRRRHVKMAKLAMESARLVLPVSQHLQHSIEAYGINARFRVVPNVAATELFHPCEERETGDARRPKRLLLVALLTRIKGVPYLLDALRMLGERRQDFTLDIVGDGASRAEYEALAREMGLSDIVRFHGLRSKAEVAEFMRSCDIFVLPSLFETFGVAAVEALASGKPLVVSDVGGLKEIVTKEVGCLVPPGDAEALARVLDWMLDHHQDYDAEAIASYARARYSREVVGRMLHEVYLEAIG
ncbi:MAG: glycosyltransferase [Chloroflexi bacterium]|nr:glycosyltransferase [Chloroflexota bacterium]